jgi:hypothetical protein
MSNVYQTAKSIQRLEASLRPNRINKVRKVKQKLTWRQRLRNWFNKDLEDSDIAEIALQDVEPNGINGEGMRFQLYRAAGGYVVETRFYDQKNDRNQHKLYIIKDEEDVGNAIGKIITMESLR